MIESQLPDISVVIPSYNRLHSLRDTLKGLADQTLDPGRFEVIVVDNASGDGTLDAVRTLKSSVPYYLRVERIPGANRGPAPARNFGVSLTQGKIVAFTDSDCRPDPQWLELGLAAFDDPTVAFATGVVDLKPEQLNQLTFFSRRTVVSSWEHPTYPTANAFYRKQIFLDFKGFTEELSFPDVFGTAIEAADTDLAWRIREAGHPNRFLPDAIIHHEVQSSRPVDWLLEPLRLFLVPALIRRHPAMRQALLSHNLFFYRGSLYYYLALILGLALLLVAPEALLYLPFLLLMIAILRSRSLNPRRVAIRAGQILLNAARIYVMSFTLLYGSVRFRTLVL